MTIHFSEKLRKYLLDSLDALAGLDDDMAQPESKLSGEIVKWMNKQPNTVARKKHMTPYGMRGDPDIYGCVLGQMFLLEIKLGKNTPTKLQGARLVEWHEAGAITGVAWTMEQAQEFYGQVRCVAIFKQQTLGRARRK
jgi:hypothetical protein